jgi:hypothetical protein
MKNLLKSFVCGEEGFLLSTEGVLVGTVAVIGMLIGLVAVRDSIILELQDFGSAVGAMSQDYNYTGVTDAQGSTVEGSAYDDLTDGTVDDATINVTSPAGAAEAAS